jgi:hypothetical protein
VQLDELVDLPRRGSDTIAERMRALDAVPDGRSDSVASSTTLPQFPTYELGTGEVVDVVTAGGQVPSGAWPRSRWLRTVRRTRPDTPGGGSRPTRAFGSVA